MYVEFGSDSAIEGYRDPDSPEPEKVRYRPLEGQRVTRVLFPEGTSLMEAFHSAVDLVQYHMAGAPAWVDSDSTGLESLLKEHFAVTQNRPRTWGRDTGADQLPKISDLMATAMLPFALAAFMLSLRTYAGRDWQATVMGNGAAAGAGTGVMRPADYIGLTADNTAPDATRTTLPGEVTSGSLARSQATFGHTNGTTSYTLTKTFTSDQAIIVAKIGVFNAPTGGTMAFETMMNAPANLVSGDQLAITETVTL